MQTEPEREPGVLATDSVLVRTMRADDLAAVVAIDAQASGRRRPRYFQLMLDRALEPRTLQVSLVAELDGRTAGYLIASLYYGEYGVAEPSASIDAIGVDPLCRGRHVGRAMMRQLRLNLGALHISALRTEVAWDDFDLLGFFKREGFAPARRLCLECRLDPTSPAEAEAEDSSRM
jgi:ribosomal protein S18 acetylase RimI-like enzyme